MVKNTLSRIMEFKGRSLDELKAKYEELFIGQKAPSNNKVYLWRKIAYRMQELEYKKCKKWDGSIYSNFAFPFKLSFSLITS